MSEKKFINLEKDLEYVDDYVVFKSTKFGKTYYLDSSVKEYTEYELEEYIILKHPTLELFDNNKMKKIWVKQELYDKVYPTDKVRIIEYKGEVKLDPRYDDKDLVIQKYKFGR
ncbi:TPA: hypothetical protein QCO65_005297 [Bacillus cereus]|uniref:hypothetical protein n=1 Tax=Bacillus sp. FSL H8-0545 TaxID=2921402 RepID=UPI0030F96987|nr:hypothetical protein [Bacillus cereus]HDR7613455.1 hypothetical protein [Bacillus mycoides]